MEVPELAENDRADLVLLEVQREPESVVREFEKLASHRVLEAIDLGDAVADCDDAADIGGDETGVEVLQAFLDDLGDLFRADAQVPSP